MGTQVSEPFTCQATPSWPYPTMCLFIADTEADWQSIPEIVEQHGAGYKRIGDLVVRCVPEFVREKCVAGGIPSKTIAEVSAKLVDAVADIKPEPK